MNFQKLFKILTFHVSFILLHARTWSRKNNKTVNTKNEEKTAEEKPDEQEKFLGSVFSSESFGCGVETSFSSFWRSRLEKKRPKLRRELLSSHFVEPELDKKIKLIIQRRQITIKLVNGAFPVLIIVQKNTQKTSRWALLTTLFAYLYFDNKKHCDSASWHQPIKAFTVPRDADYHTWIESYQSVCLRFAQERI